MLAVLRLIRRPPLVAMMLRSLAAYRRRSVLGPNPADCKTVQAYNSHIPPGQTCRCAQVIDELR